MPADASGAAGQRQASLSALGQELSDDSLTMSPEEKRSNKRGATVRSTRARMPVRQRLTLSLPRPARRDSPSAHEGRERSPRARGPKTLEERVLDLELKAHERSVSMQQLYDENTKMMLEMRRELYATKSIVEGHANDVAMRFDGNEKVVGQYLDLLNAHQAEIAQKIEQLPQAGTIVMTHFQNITAEIEHMKSTKGETLTTPMLNALKNMETKVANHERQIAEAATVDARLGAHLNSLDEAYAQVLATLESVYTAPDGANIPEAPSDWRRPARRTAGLQGEQFYGGPGGHPGRS